MRRDHLASDAPLHTPHHRSTARPTIPGWISALLGLGLCFTLPSAAANAAAPQNLCDIPITEGHRAAIEERYLPALDRLLSHWERQGTDDATLGTLATWGKTDVFDRHALAMLQKAVPFADISPGDLPTTDLPRRQGPDLLPWQLDAVTGSTSLVLNDAQQKTVNSATQAILHWSCVMTDEILFVEATGFVLELRGDFAGYGQGYVTSFEDWRQLAAISAQQMKATQRPNDLKMQNLSMLSKVLLQDLYNPVWERNNERLLSRETFRFLTANWILSSTAEPAMRLDNLYDKILSNVFDDAGKSTVSIIYRNSLNFFRESLKKLRSTSSSHRRQRYELTVAMHRLSVLTGDFESSSCLLSSIRNQFIADSRRKISDGFKLGWYSKYLRALKTDLSVPEVYPLSFPPRTVDCIEVDRKGDN